MSCTVRPLQPLEKFPKPGNFGPAPARFRAALWAPAVARLHLYHATIGISADEDGRMSHVANADCGTQTVKHDAGLLLTGAVCGAIL